MISKFLCEILVLPNYPTCLNGSFQRLAGAKITDDGESSPAGLFFETFCHGGAGPVLSSPENTARPPLLLLGPGGAFVHPIYDDLQIR